MPFKRITRPAAPVTEAMLTAQMVGIGMNFAAPAKANANIEDTLVFASELGMLEDDLRVLSILVQWLETHQDLVHTSRLLRLVQERSAPRIHAFWAAVGTWLEKDPRFRRFQKLYEGEVISLLAVGNEFQIARRGEDSRFAGTPLLVPAGILRQRKGDVLAPVALARTHKGYRNRLLMGATWRADIWTALEADPSLSAAAVARKAYCAFATAWRVKRDFDAWRQC
jgi:hypothetical protein